MYVEIIRLEKSAEGTFGLMRIDGQVFCCTLELPEQLNKPDKSCIPSGILYACHVTKDLRIAVTDVPGRTLIRIHAGNTIDDIEGCILLGSSFGIINGKRGVIDSATTIKRFLNRRNSDNFMLMIREI
jgi:hypothetical protein